MDLVPRLIPVLQLAGNRLVKTKRFRDPVYVGDPLNTVRIFNDKEVDELFIVDILATSEATGPNFRLIEQIVSEAFMPVAVGGGIQSVEHALALIGLGVEKVVVQSAIFCQPDAVQKIAEVLGSQAVVGALDFVESDGNFTTRPHKNFGVLQDVKNAIGLAERLGVGELLCTDVSREGTRLGIRDRFVREVASFASKPLVVQGGAAELGNLRDAVANGADALAGGAMFFFSGSYDSVNISYPSRFEIERHLSESSIGGAKE